MHFLGEAGVKVEPVLLDEQHQQGVRGNHCLRGYQQRHIEERAWPGGAGNGRTWG